MDVIIFEPRLKFFKFGLRIHKLSAFLKSGCIEIVELRKPANQGIKILIIFTNNIWNFVIFQSRGDISATAKPEIILIFAPISFKFVNPKWDWKRNYMDPCTKALLFSVRAFISPWIWVYGRVWGGEVRRLPLLQLWPWILITKINKKSNKKRIEPIYQNWTNISEFLRII